MSRWFCFGKKDFCNNTEECRYCKFADGSGSVNENGISLVLSKIFGDDYDIDRLKELVQADREGRCVVHPLKSDDEVYIIFLSRVFLFEVISAVWYGESPIYKAMHGIHLCYVFNQNDIGKTVFLAREEAEAVLKKMKEGDR